MATQFFKSFIQWNIGGTDCHIPALPGADLQVPQSFIVPPVIGSLVQVNYCRGLRVPIVDVQLVHLDQNYTSGFMGPLSQLFLSHLFDRATLYLDTILFGDGLTTGLNFWDGRSGFTLLGAKFELMQITANKGSDLGIHCRFCGSGLATIPVPFAAPPVWSNSKPLRFQAVNLSGGSIASKAWAIDMLYSNNHRPVQQVIAGSPFPYAMVAKTPVATMNLITETENGDLVPNTNLGLVVTGTAGTATITLTNVINNTVDNRRVEIPRNMRRHALRALGNQGDISPVSYISFL